MKIKFKIISFDKIIGQIGVRFYTDAWPEGQVHAIDVPIVEGSFLQGEALEVEILSRAPVWHLERTYSVATATGAEAIQALVQPEVVTFNVPADQPGTTLQSF